MITTKNLKTSPSRIISVFMLVFIIGCQEDKVSLNNNVFFSNQKGNMLYCTVYYHFDNDSLFVFNSATNQKLKFSIGYEDGFIFLNNNTINNYSLKIIEPTSNESDVDLIDNSNYLSINDTIKLNKISIGHFKNKSLENKFWLTTKPNIEQNEKDSTWLYMSNKENLDIYSKLDGSSKIHESKGKYELIVMSEKLKILNLSNHFSSFLIIECSNENLSCFYLPCGQNKGEYIDFNKYSFNDSLNNFIGNWRKIESTNEFDLPDKLIIDNDSISFDNLKREYEFGLKKQFISVYDLPKLRNKIRIVSIEDDTLYLSIKNSLKEDETATYLKSSQNSN